MNRDRFTDPLDAGEIIRALNLYPLEIEGGWFTETYPPAERSPSAADPDRPVSMAILYSLTPDTFSEIHRLPGDEIFHASLATRSRR